MGNITEGVFTPDGYKNGFAIRFLSGGTITLGMYQNDQEDGA